MRKVCTKCKEELSLSMFIKQEIQRHPMCDPCRKEYNREYQKKLGKLRKQKLW